MSLFCCFCKCGTEKRLISSYVCMFCALKGFGGVLNYVVRYFIHVTS